MGVLQNAAAQSRGDWNARLAKIVRKEPTSPVNYEAWKKDPKLAAAILKECMRDGGGGSYNKGDIEAAAMYAKGYGLKFSMLESTHEMNRDILTPMAVDRFGDDLLWIIPSTRVEKIGNSMAPILHYAVEVPSDRIPYVQYLRQYYLDVRKRPDIWKDIINARATNGFTLLDYAEYLKQTKQVATVQKDYFEQLVKLVQDDGGVHYRYVQSSNDPAQWIAKPDK